RAPVYARINTLRVSRDDFLAQHTGSAPVPNHPLFVRLTSVPSDALDRGDCYIQDPSTSAAVELLAPSPGEIVLDACAAPGGKSGLIAAMMQNTGELVASDRNAGRVEKLSGNLSRLGVSIARIERTDWTSGAAVDAFAPRSFDRILLDAPCSNTGVLRRRVDARWRLRPNDFTRMPEEQLSILRRLAPLLKPGGTLVYSTCSIEPEENEVVVSRIAAEFPFLRPDATTSILPFRDGFDGAYAARLVHAG
ncbi:MAG TPA: RsmB/NOP family class I SAM-dependent RNA methyltransferase, partial [Chthoniobacterales bacterium]|nr:RsmB/NOP family class I SAM-dependent RNA methyltransferase [Chthoniobacterales bacterium]